jgi:hypothetical protein
MKNEHCGCSSFKKRKRAELTSAKPWRTLTALGIDWDEIREAPHGGFACRTTFFYHGTSLQYIRLIAPVNSAIRRFVYSGLISYPVSYPPNIDIPTSSLGLKIHIVLCDQPHPDFGDWTSPTWARSRNSTTASNQRMSPLKFQRLSGLFS